MAFEIIRKLNQTPILYTFGAPRIGNKEFVDYHYKILNNSYRVVHN